MVSRVRGSDHVYLDVLMVDDQLNVASSTADVLRSDGLVVETATTVDDALQVIASSDIQCVILDHHLAGDDGGRLLDSAGHLPPVIVMSGMDRDALVEMQATYGNQLFACLTKPVGPLTLIETVRSAIGSK